MGYGQSQESVRLVVIELGKTFFESAEYAARYRAREQRHEEVTQVTRDKRLHLIIVLLTCFRVTALAEDWQGISPGVASRADVVRLFEKCAERTIPCEFEHKGNRIRIVFSGTVQDDFYQCSKNVPADTVLLVEVTPRAPISLNSLRRSHSLRKLGSTGKFSGYVDERAGLVLKSYKDKIVQLNYVAPASKRARCEDYYSDPIKFVEVVTHCPPVTIEGPAAAVITGQTIKFKADARPDPKMTLVWSVSGGRILSQTGREMSLDTSELNAQTLTVTVQARGSCSVENSLTLQVVPRRSPD